MLFLANIQPDLQREVREQCAQARFVALDSMNLWIDIAHESLLRTIALVDCVILNDGELKQLTDEPNLVRAARAVLDLGPSVVVAKQGEYGAALFTREGYFALPAYPTPDVVDPTGAGDTFAGGFMGYIAAHPDEEVDDALLRRAMAYGTALASFNVEAFGTERMLAPERRRDRRPRRRAAAQLVVRRRAGRAALSSPAGSIRADGLDDVLPLRRAQDPDHRCDLAGLVGGQAGAGSLRGRAATTAAPNAARTRSRACRAPAPRPARRAAPLSPPRVRGLQRAAASCRAS